MNSKDRTKLCLCQKHFKPLEVTDTGMRTKGCVECNSAPPPRPLNDRPKVTAKQFAEQHKAAAAAAAEAQATIECKNWALGKHCGMGDRCRYLHLPEKAGECQAYAKRQFCNKNTMCKLLPLGHWKDPNESARKRAREGVMEDDE